MANEWIRMGLLVGVVIVMFIVLKSPKKGGEKKEE